MTNSHLILILRTLSKKEERELRKWLNSPAHNHREDVILLFEYLLAGQHLYEEKFLQKERVYSRIFPKEAYDDAKIRQTMHFLLKSVEEFLIYHEQQSDEVRARMALASVFRKRKLDRAFKKAIKNVETLQNKASYRNEQFLRNEYLLQIEKYQFQEGKKRTTEMNLQEASDALDETFIADKLRQSCLMIAHQLVYKAKYSIGLLEDVLTHIEKNDLLHLPAIAVYFYGYKAFTSDDSQGYFAKLREAIEAHKEVFPNHELRDIYLMAINYCVTKLNVGEANMLQNAFDLYQSGIEAKILIENNNLTHFTFRNIVNIGTKLKKLDWIEHFIANYSKYLADPYRLPMIQFSEAKLHFARKDYSKAMQLLAQSDFDDILSNLHGKSMLIIMYYEEGEIDALESLIESMRAYIRRKEIMGSFRTIYSNLIKYTRKLIRINPFEQSEVQQLRVEIENARPLPEKEWFIQQVDSLQVR